ncbi:hypothetical protein F4859DRAFT_521612 [Xylaria cf. heliscus]|nr:hypothetical protein F4859DRAFT_521612 [Xylaria cf. heliscus]
MIQSSLPEPQGWSQQKRAIEKLLLNTKERSIVSTLYLHGLPTSEFNTSLVDYVVRQAKAGLAPTQVLYIAGIELDKECAAALPGLFGYMGSNNYTCLLTINSAKEFCDKCEQGTGFINKSLVLMIDVRMSATVAEEVMFGLVLERLQEAICLKKTEGGVYIAVLLLGLRWFSERTFKLFEKLMQTTRRSVEEIRPFVKLTFPTVANLNEIIEEALKKGQRLIFSFDVFWSPFSVLEGLNNYKDKDGNCFKVLLIPSEQGAPETLQDVIKSSGL